MIVRVPASSANLGPGFDALGMALALHAKVGLVDQSGTSLSPSARVADEHHPATVAFRAAGGTGEIWVHSPIPAGRGLGFSGAVRVGGAVLAVAQQCNGDRAGIEAARPALLELATRLEGHADNAAASLYGGVVATAAGQAVRVPLALDPAVVVWIPASVTATDESRRALAVAPSFEDAVFNIGRTALLVAALAAGDVEALRYATDDRLHQHVRLDGAPESRAAIERALDCGAWCAWLSGSGPSVAALCAPGDAEALAAAIVAPDEGSHSRGAHSRVMRIDHEGAVVDAS